MEVQGRIKSAVSAAKTRSRIAAELAVAREDLARAEKIWREVQALRAPTPVLVEEIPEIRGSRQIWGMDEARVWTLPGHSFDAERRQALENSWRDDRYRERGETTPPYIYRSRVKDLEDRLAKIERKLKTLMF